MGEEGWSSSRQGGVGEPVAVDGGGSDDLSESQSRSCR
jgi:hypothetical protein